MHCGSCAYLIEDVLKEQSGVKDARVDFIAQTCEVEADDEIKLETLVKAINEIPGESFTAQAIT